MTTLSPSPSPPNSLSKPPVCFSPPLIAMLVIIAAAFIIITYSRAISRQLILIRCRWQQWRRSYSVNADIESLAYSDDQSYDPNYGYHLFSRHGLDDAVIKTIPISVHTRKGSVHECAVCLLEFEDDDYVRTLPVCFHAFHVDCIDIWLKCHANCPLCRSIVFRPFVPVMSARIRPNFDDVIIQNAILDPSPEPQHSRQRHSITGIGEITQDVSASLSPTRNQSEDRFNRRDYLKRSYSFGFERNLGSSRLVTDFATASPWRYRRGGSFWCKRPSPFSLSKTRVFSFRYSRGMKSPFFRRRSVSFLPLQESAAGGGGSSSSRRRKSFARVNSGLFSSSRLRSGDPEALLSPERYNRRC